MSTEIKKRLFLNYYRSNKFLNFCSLPPRPASHHYRFELFSGHFFRLRKSIRFKRALRKEIIRSEPKNVYFTPNEWLDPIRLRENSDILISSPLYLDIDYQKLPKKSFSCAFSMTKKLIKHVRRVRNRLPSWIVFSGKRGFHIYYWHWDDVSKLERPQDRLEEFKRNREVLMRDLEKHGIIVDRQVTVDPWRILRLPGTLHGETGFVAIKIDRLEDFSIDKAIIFDEKIYEGIFGVDLDFYKI